MRPLGGDWPRDLAAALKEATGQDLAGLACPTKPASRRCSTRRKWPRSAFAPMCWPIPTSARCSTRFPTPTLESFYHERRLTCPSLDFERSWRWRRTRRPSCRRRRTISTRSRSRASAGGGLVKIRATAKGRILGVDIDESLLQPSEKTMVEDLIAAAINDARAKADAAADERNAEDDERPAAAAGVQAALLSRVRTGS